MQRRRSAAAWSTGRRWATPSTRSAPAGPPTSTSCDDVDDDDDDGERASLSSPAPSSRTTFQLVRQSQNEDNSHTECWRQQLLKKLVLLQPFNGLFSTTTCISQYQKGKTSLDLNEARDDGGFVMQWHQLDHMQTICTLLQTDNHTNTSSYSIFTGQKFFLMLNQQCKMGVVIVVVLIVACRVTRPTMSKHCSLPYVPRTSTFLLFE